MMLNTKDILISIQRALIEKITPNVRSVCIIVNQDYLELRFYYDQEPTEEEDELASLADTEFIADFPSPEYSTKFSQKVVPYPRRVTEEGFCVYHRYEPEFD